MGFLLLHQILIMEKLFDLFYQCASICTDTRKIEKECLFICLSGDNFNGNTFAYKALDLGAKFVISDDITFCTNDQIFYVENSLDFLQKLAHFHRQKFNFPFIGITGSNGKTSTKELINSVLSKKYKVLATQGNLNNHIGVPLTILKVNSSHEIAIIEMGANKFKDIEELCLIAKPTHGIITNIGKAHLEGFIDFEGVLKTKKELFDSILRSKGIIFYNSDDEVLTRILPLGIKMISYGTNKNADIQGELGSLSPYVNMKWSSSDFQSKEIETSMIGKYNFYNFLAAISFGKFFHVDNEQISQAIKEYEPTNNRSQIQKTTNNTVILDAYNANPTSMKSAIESFALIENQNKIMVLGDMFELGLESKVEHEQIVKMVLDLKLKCYFIGSNFFQNEILKNNLIIFFKTKEDFRSKFSNQSFNNQLILLKGSRGIGLENLVELF